MKTYFDSSAFVKRFVDEPGSETVERACLRATQLGLSVICVPEIISAMNRRRRERSLTSPQYVKIKQCIVDDTRDADIIHLTPGVVNSSVGILEDNPLRAMDALHIASALAWGADVFVSADKRQLQTARNAGLKTLKA